MIAWVYSFGLFNAYIRRRWQRLFGNPKGDHSILNALWWLETVGYNKEKQAINLTKQRNFQRDFSFVYVVMFIFTHLFSRAVSATNNAAGVTPSPWVDLVRAAFITLPVTFGMMVITSMFDFAMSVFVGDEHPKDPP